MLYEKMEPAKYSNRILMKKFLSHLAKRVEYMQLNSKHYGWSKTVNLRLDEGDGETLLLLLDSRRVTVSAGPACSAHSAVTGHVLTALGLTDEQAKASIRVSLSDETACDEMCEAENIIADSVNMLRRK